MKVTGSATLNAPRDQVWAALHDPAVLVDTIPGCRQFEQVGTDVYRGSIETGVASTKGVYDGEVVVKDQDAPSSFVLHAVGAGAPGTVDAEVQVRLTEVDDGATRLDYDADAVVGGMLGGVGRRMLTSVAERTADQFFAAVDDVLTGELAPEFPSGQELAGPAIGVPGVTGEPISITESYEPERRDDAAPILGRASSPSAFVFAAVVIGALIFLVGILVGWLIAGIA